VEGISHKSHTLDKDGYMIDEGGNDVLSCGFVGVFLQTVSSSAMEGRVEVNLTIGELLRCGR
jgi:hypothetical protein